MSSRSLNRVFLRAKLKKVLRSSKLELRVMSIGGKNV